MARRTRNTKPVPKSVPKDDDYVVIGDNRGHLVTEDEWRAWVAAGCPLTDAERAEHREPRQPVKRDEHGKKIPAKPKQTVRYHRNGKPVTDSVNKLSTIAYHFTRDVTAKGSPRMTGGELRALLVKAGITEPETTEWSHDLGNGNVISTTIDR